MSIEGIPYDEEKFQEWFRTASSFLERVIGKGLEQVIEELEEDGKTKGLTTYPKITLLEKKEPTP